MENQMNAMEQRKRKFLLVLPVIVLPFLTLLFWALGGGKVDAAATTQQDKAGLNSALPDANLKDEKGLDKMSYYDQAARDSTKLRESLATDPYNGKAGGQDTGSTAFPVEGNTGSYGMSASAYNGSGYQTSTDAKIYQKLDQLDQTLNQPATPTSSNNTGYAPNNSSNDQATLQRLEKMMLQMQSGQASADPETEQLDGMLEKVLDIQYPERVQEKIRKTSAQHKGQVFAVAAAGKRNYISQLEENTNQSATAGNGFYSLDEPVVADTGQNAIDAVVHETQTIVNGSTVKLRLVDDIYVNGTLIPKDNFIYGKAALNGERLSIKITGIRFKKGLFPVELSVFDTDGMDGIYVPGAIAREVAKESADRAIQDVSFGSMSPSLGIQAASAGVEAAKSLFSKKVKVIKVTVKAGYKVLLRDEKQKQDNQ
jgi:conjugative transposon TraM protein